MNHSPDQSHRTTDWIETFTGRRFWPLEPRADEIQLVDICHALSLVCRYTGHCKQFWSVGAHTLLVHDLIEEMDSEYGLEALLHDASEAYLADITRPVKKNLKEYKSYERRLELVIAERFGIVYPYPSEVKEADEIALAIEVTNLFESRGRDWGMPIEELAQGRKLPDYGDPDKVRVGLFNRIHKEHAYRDIASCFSGNS